MGFSWMFSCCSSANQYSRAPSHSLNKHPAHQNRQLLFDKMPNSQEREDNSRVQSEIFNLYDLNFQQLQRTDSIATQIFKQEVRQMSIILEQFKLEIITLLPKILQIARKSLTKKKQSLIEKTKQQIIKTINKVRLEVIEEYGELVGCKNEEEFFSKLDKLRVSQDVQKIDDQIIGAIEMALQGQEPDLKVELEDEKLDCECYKQIVSKLYSVIRFKLYQNIKQKLRLSANSGNLTENDLRESKPQNPLVRFISALICRVQLGSYWDQQRKRKFYVNLMNIQ